MPLDIGINKGNGEMGISVTVGMNDYSAILERINSSSDFPILNKNLSDYYGDSEVYLNQLNDLRAEVLKLQSCFKYLKSESVFNFLSSFYKMIENAITDKKTIMFLGD